MPVWYSLTNTQNGCKSTPRSKPEKRNPGQFCESLTPPRKKIGRRMCAAHSLPHAARMQ